MADVGRLGPRGVHRGKLPAVASAFRSNHTPFLSCLIAAVRWVRLDPLAVTVGIGGSVFADAEAVAQVTKKEELGLQFSYKRATFPEGKP